MSPVMLWVYVIAGVCVWWLGVLLTWVLCRISALSDRDMKEPK